MPVPQDNPAAERRWLTVQESSEYLHCCPNVVRNLLHKGELKAARLGNLYRIEKSDLDQLMLRRKRVVPPYRKGTRPWVAKRHAALRKRGGR